MTFTKEYKEAVLSLPRKEKDSLLLRLLKKDEMLVKRLHFELIDHRNVDEARTEMEQFVLEEVNFFIHFNILPRIIKINMSFVSARISEHKYITKDNFGDAYLNLLLVDEVLKKSEENLARRPINSMRKLSIYIVDKIYKCLIIREKLHPDYHSEFTDMLQSIGTAIESNSCLKQISHQKGLNPKWLLENDIPEKIAEIKKQFK